MADREHVEREVLTSLPRTRPTRRSAKRTARPEPGDVEKASAGAQAGAGGATKRAAGAARRAAPKPAGGQRRRKAPRRPVPPAGYAAPSGARDGDGASELVGTAIQAVAELTQIGLTVGRQTLRSMLERLPKP